MIAANGVTAVSSRQRVCRPSGVWCAHRSGGTGSGSSPRTKPHVAEAPDARALELFLRKRGNGTRSGSLTFPLGHQAPWRGRIRCRGAGRCNERPLRTCGPGLFSFDRSEPALSGPDHPAAAEVGTIRQDAALYQ